MFAAKATRNTDAQTENVFESGRPTGPDVDAIIKAHPVEAMFAGYVVKYDSIASIIKEPRTSDRFKTVAGAWRRRMFSQYNLLVEAIPNVGYSVVEGQGRVRVVANVHKQVVRRVLKNGAVAQSTKRDGLSDSDKRTLDHVAHVAGAFKAMAQVGAVELKLQIG